MLFVIPARNPDTTLLNIVIELLNREQNSKIIIVDDGANDFAAEKIFAELGALSQVILLRHPHNKGKGAAIKTAIHEARRLGAEMIVTADADGQHAVEDILRVADAAFGSDRLFTGARRFNVETPLRSRFGNILTNWIFSIGSRNSVSDTQTGLRAIPSKYFESLLSIKLDRYDYEMEALSMIAKDGPIMEVPIQTIYEAGNPTSYFKPIRDSIKIYYVLFRYFFAVPIIALVDLVAFVVANQFMSPVLAFTTVRMATMTVYFYLMRSVVFRSENNIAAQLVKFIPLCISNMLVANFLIYYGTQKFAVPSLVSYFLASAIMVVFNFIIQRKYIFT